MSFHMGSLGFLTPFQFYASDNTADKYTSSAECAEKKVALKVPVYQHAIEKVLRGKIVYLLELQLEYLNAQTITIQLAPVCYCES